MSTALSQPQRARRPSVSAAAAADGASCDRQKAVSNVFEADREQAAHERLINLVIKTNSRLGDVRISRHMAFKSAVVLRTMAGLWDRTRWRHDGNHLLQCRNHCYRSSVVCNEMPRHWLLASNSDDYFKTAKQIWDSCSTASGQSHNSSFTNGLRQQQTRTVNRIIYLWLDSSHGNVLGQQVTSRISNYCRHGPYQCIIENICHKQPNAWILMSLETVDRVLIKLICSISFSWIQWKVSQCLFMALNVSFSFYNGEIKHGNFLLFSSAGYM